MRDLLRLIAGCSTSAIGAVTRVWVSVWGALAVPLWLMSYHTNIAHWDAAVTATPFAIICAFLLSLPVMVVLAIGYVVFKW